MIADVAKKQEFHRTTAYRFYPHLEILLLEASLAAGKSQISEFLDSQLRLHDPDAHLQQMLDVVLKVTEQYGAPWMKSLRHALALPD